MFAVCFLGLMLTLTDGFNAHTRQFYRRNFSIYDSERTKFSTESKPIAKSNDMDAWSKWGKEIKWDLVKDGGNDLYADLQKQYIKPAKAVTNNSKTNTLSKFSLESSKQREIISENNKDESAFDLYLSLCKEHIRQLKEDIEENETSLQETTQYSSQPLPSSEYHQAQVQPSLSQLSSHSQYHKAKSSLSMNTDPFERAKMTLQKKIRGY